MQRFSDRLPVTSNKMKDPGKRSQNQGKNVQNIICLFGLFVSLQWFDLDAPESSPFPGKYKNGLTDLQGLMMLRCFRVDRVYRAITNYVTGRMGEQYVTPPVVSLESVFDQSTPFSPIVFILSPGADPAGELGKLAEVKGYGGNRFKLLAMGQGQEKVGVKSFNELFVFSVAVFKAFFIPRFTYL